MIPDTTKAAVLDLGTNTFHLLIAEQTSTGWKTLLRKETGVKLGEGGINQGRIGEAAFRRGLDALKQYGNEINHYRPAIIRCVGTAALRKAANGPEFIRRVKDETGISIALISGEEEAGLIFKGVLSVLPDLEGTALIMDIGGGSVEFILFRNRQILWKYSFEAGAAKLMEQFHHTDPISAEEIRATEIHLNRLLAPLTEQIYAHRPGTLVGSAGSFETLLQIAANPDQEWQAPLEARCFTLRKEQTLEILDRLIGSTHQERMATEAIIPVRKDMIVTASILTRLVLGQGWIKNILVSTASLKEGVLASID